MSNLKDKIMDILFEDEPPIIDDAPLTDVNYAKKEPKVTKEAKKEPKAEPSSRAINAKEYLYGQKTKQTSFINYSETPKKATSKNREIEEEEKYELRENVSPIFGVINQKERKKKSASEKEIQKAVVKSPPSEYVSIVISPIYGYDTDKANDARKALDKNKKDNGESKEEINIFYDDNAPFDMPIDDSEAKEIAREAIFESVVELNKGDNNFEEVEKEEEIEEKIEEEIEEEIESPQDDELPQEELYTTEITKDEIREAFDAVTKKETYNITSLFDLDDYIKDDSEDDLFDELDGDR